MNIENKYKIAVVGLGYVGLSNAVLLAQKNKVVGVDVSERRVSLINARKSPLNDLELSHYLSTKELDLEATTDLSSAISDANYVIISTPTNFDEIKGTFDTSSVEAVISEINENNSSACIVIKSTIPIGFIDDMRLRFGNNEIIFSPEFLREGRALHDNLYPSRIVVGGKSKRARIFAELMEKCAHKSDINIQLTGAREAEAIKLFSNAYLAMRVAFFNELDSYTIYKKLNTREIIDGISQDPRIGRHYNNPSFGYGGYCLPKDTQQLLSDYGNIPQTLIGAIVESNKTRKALLSKYILRKNPKSIGVHRLLAKNGTDNFRESAIFDLIETVKNSGIPVFIYEPEWPRAKNSEYKFIDNLTDFKEMSEIIICNRYSDELEDVQSKLFTRDLFGSD